MLTEVKISSIEELQMNQGVRVFNVLAIAPFMAYAGYKASDQYIKYGMYALAGVIVLYNVKNFIKNNNRLKISKNVKKEE